MLAGELQVSSTCRELGGWQLMLLQLNMLRNGEAVPICVLEPLHGQVCDQLQTMCS